MAQKEYGINVPYDGVSIAKTLGSGKSRQARPRAVQLRLPFSLQGIDANKFEVELKSIRPRKYELRIRAKRAGSSLKRTRWT